VERILIRSQPRTFIFLFFLTKEPAPIGSLQFGSFLLLAFFSSENNTIAIVLFCRHLSSNILSAVVLLSPNLNCPVDGKQKHHPLALNQWQCLRYRYRKARLLPNNYQESPL